MHTSLSSFGYLTIYAEYNAVESLCNNVDIYCNQLYIIKIKDFQKYPYIKYSLYKENNNKAFSMFSKLIVPTTKIELVMGYI